MQNTHPRLISLDDNHGPLAEILLLFLAVGLLLLFSPWKFAEILYDLIKEKYGKRHI